MLVRDFGMIQLHSRIGGTGTWTVEDLGDDSQWDRAALFPMDGGWGWVGQSGTRIERWERTDTGTQWLDRSPGTGHAAAGLGNPRLGWRLGRRRGHQRPDDAQPVRRWSQRGGELFRPPDEANNVQVVDDMVALTAAGGTWVPDGLATVFITDAGQRRHPRSLRGARGARARRRVDPGRRRGPRHHDAAALRALEDHRRRVCVRRRRARHRGRELRQPRHG